MVRKILTYGDEELRKVSTEITEKDNSKELIQDLWDTLHSSTGVGLAAPQIGVNLRAFVVEYKDFKRAFINPKLKAHGNPEKSEEGCLSIPGVASENVVRLSDIDIEYLDEDGGFREESFDGFISRIIQHEFDHLNGVLWVDHVSVAEQMWLLPHLTKIKILK